MLLNDARIVWTEFVWFFSHWDASQLVYFAGDGIWVLIIVWGAFSCCNIISNVILSNNPVAVFKKDVPLKKRCMAPVGRLSFCHEWICLPFQWETLPPVLFRAGFSVSFVFLWCILCLWGFSDAAVMWWINTSCQAILATHTAVSPSPDHR